MYNSYAFKKKCCLLLEQKAEEKKEKKWLMNYHDKVRPALVEKYSRRVNNFITRVICQLVSLKTIKNSFMNIENNHKVKLINSSKKFIENNNF
jgi:arginyl-tRNA--protein-N-Asp/Glu arginylyltransferase